MMLKKRSKFFTVVFSFLPGAGHMFMGFMKQGVSFMSLFFGIIFLSSWLNIGPLMFVIPVLWFYAFFDAVNKMSMADEEFYAQEDYYIFSLNKLLALEGGFLKKRNLFFGILLSIFGLYLLWSNLMRQVFIYLPDEVCRTLNVFTDIFPQLAVGIVILVIGVKLILGHKKEGGNDENA